MDLPQAMDFLKVGEKQAAVELQHARGQVLKETLSDPAKLAKANPDELAKYSNYAMQPGEVKAMARSLTAAERRAAEAEGLKKAILDELDSVKDTDAFKLQEILGDQVKLANTSAADLMKLSKSNVKLTEADAKLLISNADSLVNKSIYDMPLGKAITYLEKNGGKDQAKLLQDFWDEVRGHANVVHKAGGLMQKEVLPQLRKLSPEQLMEKYPGLSREQAEAVLKDIKSLPKDFSFAYHDLFTRAGKTKTNIAAQLGKDASPQRDITLRYAIDRHNRAFAHHGPTDGLGRLESAIDFIAALRQNRSYKDGFGWDKVNKIVNEGPKLKTQVEMVRDATPDPAQIGWNKIMTQEMRGWDNATSGGKGGLELVNPQGVFPEFPQHP
jgi:hypothetical protein